MIFRGFFQHLDHEWIVRFIESKIKDANIIRLVRRMLKAGIMNNYQFEATEEGSGQGSVCSPIISCIYMHYVLVWWFKEIITPRLKGYGGLVAYADYTEVETMPKLFIKPNRHKHLCMKFSA